MKLAVESDVRRVDFGRAPIMQSLLDVTGRVATAMDVRNPAASSAAGEAAAAARIRALELEELMADTDFSADPVALIFYVAEALGYANLPAAWQGMRKLPALVARGALPASTIALPHGREGLARQWLLWRPLATAEDACALAIPGPEAVTLVAPVDGAGGSEDAIRHGAAGLLGFPNGELASFELTPTGGLERYPRAAISLSAWTSLLNAEAALLLGLISGGARRLVSEAFAYARVRQSAGRPIAQHQAVALRLADLALHHQALSVYLQASVEGCGVTQNQRGIDTVDAAYVTDHANRIARDSVQIAAGHGYVEGLPFRRLFEQVRTLTGAFSMLRAVPLASRAMPGRTP